MIPRVIRALDRCGISVTPEELADLLWLAPHLTPGAGRARPPGDEDPVPEPDPVRDETIERPVKRRRPASTEEMRQIRRQEVERAAPLMRAGGGASRGGDVAFEAPGAAALGQELDLARALRPLMRRVPSRTEFVLDEEATAHRMAESRIMSPVLLARPDRWLDVALVVDAAKTMVPWERTVLELHRLLERHGAFRRVRRWILEAPDEAGSEVRIARCRAGGLEPARWTSPRELVDPSGRRLVLVVSDAVASAWSDGRVRTVLELLAEHGPAVLVTPFPESLWAGTGLGAQHRVFLRAATPGTPNTHLGRDDLDAWSDEARPTGLPLPVLTLEPSRVRRTAELIAAAGDAWAPGVLLDEDARSGEVAPDRRSAEARVEHFLAGASPAARKLAAALAVVPLSLPIMRLVQQAVLPGSGPLPLAEVFRAGLFAPRGGAEREAEAATYEFHEDVRERLLDGLRIGDAETVLRRVSAWIERRAGRRSGFAARLRGGEVDAPEMGDEERPFALLAASALRRMGPRFAALAERLGGAAPWSAAAAEGVTLDRPASVETSSMETQTEGGPEAAPPASSETPPEPTGTWRTVIVLPAGAERRDVVDARILALRLRRYGHETAEVLGPASPGEVDGVVSELWNRIEEATAGDLVVLVAMAEAGELPEAVIKIGGTTTGAVALAKFAERVRGGGLRLVAALETDGAPPEAFEAGLEGSSVLTVSRAGERLMSGWLLETVDQDRAREGGVKLEQVIESIDRADELRERKRSRALVTQPDIPALPLALESTVQRALWVDDQPRNNDAERIRLETLDVEITIALSTEHAMEILQAQTIPFDVVISDLVRRENATAGLELLEAMRSSKIETPFILYTAPGYRDANQRAKEMGAVGVVTSPRGLLRRLDEILDLESAAAESPVDGSFRSEWEAAAEAPELLAEAETTEDPERSGALAQSAVIALGQNRETEGSTAWHDHHDLRLRGLRLLARSKTEGATLADLAEALVVKAEALLAQESERLGLAEEARVILEERMEELPRDPDGAQAFLLLRAKRVLIESLAATGEDQAAMKEVFWSKSFLEGVGTGFDRHHRELAADLGAELARRFALGGHAEEAREIGRFAVSLVDEEGVPERRRDRARLAELLLELARHEEEGEEAEAAEASYRRAVSILHVQITESRALRLPGEVLTLGEAQHRLARVLQALGRVDEAIAVGADAIDTLRTLREQHPTRFSQAFLQQGLRLVGVGRRDEAQKIAEELRDFTALLADPTLQSHAARLLGEVALARGARSAANREFDRAVAFAERSRDATALRQAREALTRMSEPPTPRYRSGYIGGALRYRQFTRRLKQLLTERGVRCDTKVDPPESRGETMQSLRPADHFDTMLMSIGSEGRPVYLASEVQGFLDRADVAGDAGALVVLALDEDWRSGLSSELAMKLQGRQVIDVSRWRDRKRFEATLETILEFLAEAPPLA